MIKISFNYDKNYRFDFDEKRLAKKIAKTVFDMEKLEGSFSFDVSLVTKDKIRAINKRARGINKITDVLSFPFVEDESVGASTASPLFDYVSRTIFLGDIVICYDKIISQAKLYGHSVKREYSFLLTHSMLHLLGYDHMKKKEEKIMFDKQDKVLDTLKITR